MRPGTQVGLMMVSTPMTQSARVFLFLLAFVPGLLASAAGAQMGQGEILERLRSRAKSPDGVRVIVELRNGPRAGGWLRRLQRRRMIEDRQARVIESLSQRPRSSMRRFRDVPAMALTVDASDLGRLERSPWVSGIREDRLLAPHLTETIGVIGADATIAAGWDGSGTHVAVLDTGVDSTHPFLAGRVEHEACFSANGSCPDGSIEQTGLGAGAPCSFTTACYHGTHVAGIVGGDASNRTGVAPDTGIIAVSVFSELSGSACDGAGSDPCALAFTSDIVAGLEYVLDLSDEIDISAVNMSLGGGAWSSRILCNFSNYATKVAIDQLRDAGIASIVSSGNEGETNALSSPACISSAVSVGATNDSDVVASFSNSASFLSLLAPGVSVASSVPSSLVGVSYGSASGSSMASPHVAGAWAAAREASPTSTPGALLEAFRDTGVLVTGPNGVTTPRIDVRAAISALTGVTVPLACEFDTDSDGVCDSQDNCLEIENPGQVDSDVDGYGNSCDADFDGNGQVGSSDLNIFRAEFILSAGDWEFNPAVDLDANGSIGAGDLNLFRSLFGYPPGPSGLACAGQPPCP
ncbi:S8 family serine peptidase [Myxococcota bacterium]|nr:S8 family serine peptidase [Myxococcota bacterium]